MNSKLGKTLHKLKFYFRLIINFFGLDIVPLHLSPTVHTFLFELKNLNKKIPINNVYDVGAYRGAFTKQSKLFFPQANFFLFEPNDEHNEFLEKLNVPIFNVLLSKANLHVKFWKNSNTGDSYYRESDEFSTYSSYIWKETETLDGLIAGKKIPTADFVKIDVQGAELDVLLGFKNNLSLCKFILLECSLIEYNSGSPDISKVLEYLLSQNFSPFRLCEIHYANKKLVQIDIAFINNSYRSLIT